MAVGDRFHRFTVILNLLALNFADSSRSNAAEFFNDAKCVPTLYRAMLFDVSGEQQPGILFFCHFDDFIHGLIANHPRFINPNDTIFYRLLQF